MKRKLIILIVLVLALLLLFTVFSRYLTLEQLIAQEARLRELILAHPLVSFLVGLVFYVFASLVPATSGKSLVYGWLFGFWQAVILVNFGLTIAALMTFLMSRYLFREAVQSRLGYYLNRMNRALSRDGAFYLFALRMVHFPYTFTNYVMGATSIRPRTFWWSSQLGLLPGNLIFVYAGTQFPTLGDIAKHGVGSVLSPQLVVALVLVSVFPILVRSLIRRWWPKLEETVEETE